MLMKGKKDQKALQIETIGNKQGEKARRANKAVMKGALWSETITCTNSTTWPSFGLIKRDTSQPEYGMLSPDLRAWAEGRS